MHHGVGNYAGISLRNFEFVAKSNKDAGTLQQGFLATVHSSPVFPGIFTGLASFSGLYHPFFRSCFGRCIHKMQGMTGSYIVNSGLAASFQAGGHQCGTFIAVPFVVLGSMYRNFRVQSDGLGQIRMIPDWGRTCMHIGNRRESDVLWDEIKVWLHSQGFHIKGSKTLWWHSGSHLVCFSLPRSNQNRDICWPQKGRLGIY
ncbi:hypothetical protein NPIL_117631 [Nephila pilipes]|uniref:Uncharacterized protein n=1 Tax=Nephila pilipes TaxID=299642 RepID=A0A8X6QQ32_NEPPI|nr:hypothetical protein NPIL_117631 [Nephila pilipes]